MSNHIHPVVYVGQLQGEHGGTYALRWCQECGTLIECINGREYEMVPAGVARNLPVTHARPKVARRRASKVLGRGLVELRASAPLMLKLPGGA